MSKLKDRKKAKRVAAKEMIKAGLKKAGKKLLSGALGVGSALLNTQKAYAPNAGTYVKQKDGSVKFVKQKFMHIGGKGDALPKRKNPKTSHYLPKKSTKKPKMQKRKKQEKVSVLQSQGLSTISVPSPNPVSRVGNKIGNVKVVRQSKNYGVKDLFQGSKGRKKIKETRKKRKRTFNPYD